MQLKQIVEIRYANSSLMYFHMSQNDEPLHLPPRRLPLNKKIFASLNFSLYVGHKSISICPSLQAALSESIMHKTSESLLDNFPFQCKFQKDFLGR